MEHINLHRLRHTAATIATKQHINIRVLQSMLGHSQLSTTARYITSRDDMLLEAMKGISMEIDRITGRKTEAEAVNS